jgi:hypothetical protein
MGSDAPISRKVSVKDLNRSEPIQLSSRELSTRFMVDTCLQVLATAGSIMGQFMRHPMGAEPFQTPETPELTPMDSEAKLACQKTVWSASERLQKILDDDDRWSLEFQKKTEKHFEEVAARQKEVLETQRLAAAQQIELTKEFSSPHFRYKPALCKMLDGNWLAILGDVDDINNSLIGVGPTAQIALDAFDNAFIGVLHPATQEWLRQREKNLETGGLDAPFPKVKNNELDQTGNRAVNEPPAGGIQQSGNSDEAGENSGCGGEQNPPFEPPAGGYQGDGGFGFGPR